MFGYIRTDVPNLYMKDNVLYKSLYCGVCKGIRKGCGCMAKFTLSYDVTLFSALLHNVMDKDVVIEKQHCMVHWFKKRPVAKVDDLTVKLGALNTLLAYYKILDNIQDEGKGKTAKRLFKKSYKKAKKLQPNLDKIIKEEIGKLAEIERAKTPSADVSADSFGNMMQRVCMELSGDYYTEQLGELCYLIGKWIYLIDALDDFDKDKQKGSYNPFVYEYFDADNFEALLKQNAGDINFTIKCVENRMAELLNQIKFYFNADLIVNIITKGMPLQSAKILEKECKTCKKIIKY